MAHLQDEKCAASQIDGQLRGLLIMDGVSMPEAIRDQNNQVMRRAPDRKGLLKRFVVIVRRLLLRIRVAHLRRLGMDVHPDTQISLKAHLDRTNPRGIHIGEGTLVAFGAVILSHDLARVLHSDTYIGKNCFIGAHSIILPGVRIEDGSIVATGSVVTKHVGPNTIVAGNPARVIKTGIRTKKWGVLEDAHREAAIVQAESDSAKPKRWNFFGS